MNLGEILSGVGFASSLSRRSSPQPPVTGLDYDSRRVAAGLSVLRLSRRAGRWRAVRRRRASTRRRRGGQRIASRRRVSPARWIQVEHGRQALALASRNFYGKPDERLGLTGITGTNGKTTTLTWSIPCLRAAGNTTALIGTIEYHLAGRVLPAVNTTPESLDLVRLFAELEQLGGTHATMEVSSHALALGRVYGLQFHTAVFTNLTRDHLDFHGTWKLTSPPSRMLFEGAGGPPPPLRRAQSRRRVRRAALKVHPKTRGLLVRPGRGCRTCARATSPPASRACGSTCSTASTRFPVESPLIGKINVYNILAACGAGLSYGLAPKSSRAASPTLRAVPGRFERVDEGQPFVVVVDYAHTDDALRNVIAVARGLEPEARHHAVRLRRRPRPLQASADGTGRGGGQRLRGADQRQSALRRSAGHHERRAGGHPPHGRAARRGTRPRRRHRAAP